MAAWAHVGGAQVGFLHKAKVLDFAGGNVVHVAAGFSGLMCSIIVGKVCLHLAPTPAPATHPLSLPLPSHVLTNADVALRGLALGCVAPTPAASAPTSAAKTSTPTTF